MELKKKHILRLFKIGIIYSLLTFCSQSVYENPCNPQSKILQKNLLLKFLLDDKSPYCGQASSNFGRNLGNAAKELTSFSFLSPPITGDITEKKITLTLPFGTNATNLVAKFTTTGSKVSVNGVTQTSGITANNFTFPVSYIVTGIDGSTETYTITTTIQSNPGKAYYSKLTTGSERYGNAETLNGSTIQSFTPVSTFMLTAVIDSDRDILYVGYGAAGENVIRVYENASVNTDTVTRTITVTPNTRIGGLAIDSINDRLYSVNFFTTASSNVNRFIFRINNASSRNGTLTAVSDFAQISSTALHPSSQSIRRIALDSKRDILYICDYGANSVFAYHGVSTYIHGSLWEPSRIITSVPQPAGITIDTKNNILFISSFSGNSIHVFDSGDTTNGTTGANRIITSGSLNGSSGLHFVYPFNRLYVASLNAGRILYFNDARNINGNINPDGISGAISSPTDVSIDINR
ncbi:MAG TPA: hypothetical protein PK079_05160 [Leptospiraceae bacterium]|nr:hypothetical protein [Leptospiraceae bacterium]HMX33179.1 hypothetical protein [Leptospiraceae bacterium]HMY31722.1 hypothetical protein [Leptospiraceae bacterium]HMZ64515.1 hypothetical protein [Leptospiraceae bacterium]HNA08372.1 hypothetical protein [Leptospiraceae bacterium]